MGTLTDLQVRPLKVKEKVYKAADGIAAGEVEHDPAS